MWLQPGCCQVFRGMLSISGTGCRDCYGRLAFGICFVSMFWDFSMARHSDYSTIFRNTAFVHMIMNVLIWTTISYMFYAVGDHPYLLEHFCSIAPMVMIVLGGVGATIHSVCIIEQNIAGRCADAEPTFAYDSLPSEVEE